MRTTLIAATLNEIEALPVVLPQIPRDWVDELLIVDGGSVDGTIEYCIKNGYRVLSQVGRGYGTGIREGVQAASGDIIIEFPPDGNSLASVIPALVTKIREGYDFVIVSRYLAGAKSYDDDFLTAFGNRIFTVLTNIFFRTQYTDVLVGYRAYRKDAFLTLEMNTKGLAWPLQAAIRFARKNFRVTEIPGDEPARIGGERKMRIVKTGVEVFHLLLHEFFEKSYLKV